MDSHGLEGLDELRLSQREEEQLEAMGIVTLEQLAQSNRNDLGMGKTKGDDLVTRARNILAARHVGSLAISEDAVQVERDRSSPGVVAAVRAILGVYGDPPENCNVEASGATVTFRRLQSRSGRSCAYYYDATFKSCQEAAVDRCLCHGSFYCPSHIQGHVPSIPKEFSRIVGEARKLEERLQGQRKKDLADTGITLPEEEVRAFARERGFNGFWQAVFDEIQGQEAMKQALGAGVFSTPRDPVHVLVIGEPASAKTLARDVLLRNFSELTPVGGNATRAGLVCNLATGDKGVLADSDGKTVLADEFDKISPTDLDYCLELLSNGRCDVHAARTHQVIESRFILLAFANPEGETFSGDLRLDVGVRPAVMSRFALVVKVTSIQGEGLLNLFRQSLESKGELRQLPQYYDQWLKLARLYRPEWKTSEEARERYLEAMVEVVESYIRTPLRRDPRMKDYLRRVPEAMARAEFSPVEDRHLQQSSAVFHATLATWA